MNGLMYVQRNTESNYVIKVNILQKVIRSYIASYKPIFRKVTTRVTYVVTYFKSNNYIKLQST